MRRTEDHVTQQNDVTTLRTWMLFAEQSLLTQLLLSEEDTHLYINNRRKTSAAAEMDIRHQTSDLSKGTRPVIYQDWQ